MNTKQLTRPQEIAGIIKKQFGSGALYMIGAYDLFCGSDEKHEGYFCFKFKMCKKYSYCKIALNKNNEYDVTFLKIWGGNIKNEVTYEGVGVENLHELFRSKTGLTLVAPTVIFK